MNKGNPVSSDDNDNGAKLPKVEDFFRLLFEEVPCYISVQDRDLTIVESNRRFKEDFGRTVGAKCYELYKRRDEPCVYCPVVATFKDGESHQSEEIVTSRSGKRITTLVTTAPIVNSSGEIDFVIEMSTDITRVRKLQERLTNIGLLVGSISHGMRGLIMGLDGGTYLLNTGLEKVKPTRVEEGARMIRRNVEHIRRVVLDLLYVAGEDEPQFESIKLHELAASVAQKLTKLATDLHIDFQVEIDEKVGACEVDLRSLKASITNIVENAFEACRTDGQKEAHVVRFSLTSDDDSAFFDIEDNGIGLDREALDKIFSLSFSDSGTQGTNLRLFTANKVVEKHRGIIQVKSEPRKGTSYSIRIPKVQARSKANT